MKSFTVHLPPSPPAERLDRAESLVFVKDGFSVFAFALAPLWMIVNRLWLVLFGYLVLLAALELVFMGFGAGATTQSAIAIGLNLLTGFEADSLKRWSLERKGWVLIGTVTGESKDVCERRFFESWLPTVPAIEATQLASFGGRPFGSAAAAAATGSNTGASRSWFGGWRSSRA